MVLLTNPVWLVKTRLQLQRNEGTRVPYKGILDAFTRIVKEEGWLALYRGILPALFLTSHGAVQFVVYEKLKELRPPSTDAGRSEALVYGGVSKLAAATATYPRTKWSRRACNSGIRTRTLRSKAIYRLAR